MAETSEVDIKLLAVPGIRHQVITDQGISTAEDRFDALFLMDVEERDEEDTVVTSSYQTPNVANTISTFASRALHSSFGAAYFPDVWLTDPTTDTLLQVPPTVVVLGAFAVNDSVAHPWFAPAGFTRGALNSVQEQAVTLGQANLDALYAANINPIATYANSGGPIIWGQKTLQGMQTALDRINVRRLLIEIRRQVKGVARRLVFEPNRESTLNLFQQLIRPKLQRIQDQSGLDKFKVQIDTTTTTTADVENNTIRGRIFIMPTRTSEFVSLDFAVTNAGSAI
jgi:phage tail sheath protein FI